MAAGQLHAARSDGGVIRVRATRDRPNRTDQVPGSPAQYTARPSFGKYRYELSTHGNGGGDAVVRVFSAGRSCRTPPGRHRAVVPLEPGSCGRCPGRCIRRLRSRFSTTPARACGPPAVAGVRRWRAGVGIRTEAPATSKSRGESLRRRRQAAVLVPVPVDRVVSPPDAVCCRRSAGSSAALPAPVLGVSGPPATRAGRDRQRRPGAEAAIAPWCWRIREGAPGGGTWHRLLDIWLRRPRFGGSCSSAGVKRTLGSSGRGPGGVWSTPRPNAHTRTAQCASPAAIPVAVRPGRGRLVPARCGRLRERGDVIRHASLGSGDDELGAFVLVG